MLKVANSVINASRITGTLPVANGGTGVTTSTGTGNTVLSASPTLSGDVTLSTGNVVIGTSGKGIDFSATSSGSGTMTSELLADYEEGNFSPTISGSTTAGTGTYNAQGAFYTKVGNIVNVQIYINLATHTGTGNIRITNLPFTSAAGGNTYSSATIGYLDNCTLVALNYPLAFIPPSTTYINLSQSPVGGGALNDVAMDTSFSIMISATYKAA